MTLLHLLLEGVKVGEEGGGGEGGRGGGGGDGGGGKGGGGEGEEGGRVQELDRVQAALPVCYPGK